MLPEASFAASHLQQFSGKLTVAHLSIANKVLSEIKELNLVINFATPKLLDSPTYLAFSDASQGKTSYGQTGFIAGLHLPAGGDGAYHVIDWKSSKQSRVSFSSIGAEILAAATSADRATHICECLIQLINPDVKLSLVLAVDSLALHSTITTLHEGADYRLRPIVSRLRGSFENGEITVM